MKTNSFEKRKKRFTIVAMLYPLILFCLFLIQANNGLKGLTLRVRSIDTHLATYKNNQLSNGNYFISGITGELRWKPTNISQSIMLITTQNKDIDLFDIIGLMITAGIMLYMFKQSKDGKVFTDRLSKGFALLLLFICVSGMLIDLAKMELGRYYISYVTGGKFTGDYPFKAINYYYMLFNLMIFLVAIPKNALALQKEQELTI